ncbi:DUF1636 domain-containing protein [Labrenzia sp. CE80]|uniref:DUF1636 family protein n=1 Tax=Labrenzia sp. CE80 TaxID=1788986 RepID=UPI0013895C49|nr:DUF1636 domain-containing protein [Labrenzia sp. CE80]
MLEGDRAILSVCTRCRVPGDGCALEERPGYRLARGIKARFSQSDAARLGVELRGVRCMSQCKRHCVVALSGTGKFTLVFGDLDASVDADAVLRLAAQYAEAPNGLIERPDRPEPLRAGILGRIPPIGFDDDLVDTSFTIKPMHCKEVL